MGVDYHSKAIIGCSVMDADFWTTEERAWKSCPHPVTPGKFCQECGVRFDSGVRRERVPTPLLSGIASRMACEPSEALACLDSYANKTKILHIRAEASQSSEQSRNATYVLGICFATASEGDRGDTGVALTDLMVLAESIRHILTEWGLDPSRPVRLFTVLYASC